MDGNQRVNWNNLKEYNQTQTHTRTDTDTDTNIKHNIGLQKKNTTIRCQCVEMT